MFLPLERSSMRDRLMQLVGGDLHRATDAVGEAGERVSKYLGMQLLANLGFGLPMAIGLWLIGVPGALLWSLLAALLRFVPCLCSFSTAPQAQVRYVARRLMRRQPDLQVLVALWNAPPELLLPQATQQLGVSAVAHTLGEAVARMVHGEDAALVRPAQDAPVGPQDRDRLRALALSGALEPALRDMFDRAAQRASDVVNMPLAMVSLVSDDCQIGQGAAARPGADLGSVPACPAPGPRAARRPEAKRHKTIHSRPLR